MNIPAEYKELTKAQKNRMLGYVRDGMFLNTQTDKWVKDRQGRCWCSPGTTDRIIVPEKFDAGPEA